MKPDGTTESMLRSNPLLGRFVGWAGVVSLILAITSQILGNVHAVRNSLFELFGLRGLVYLHYLMAVFVVALFVAGCSLLFIWIARKAGPRAGRHRRAIVVGAMLVSFVGASTAIYASFPDVPDLRLPMEDASTAWRGELLDLRSDGGGLRTSRTDPAADRQVWSTAQTLVAVLSRAETLSDGDMRNIREQFDFFERVQLPAQDGWGYMEHADWGVTEVIGWVAVAIARSLRPVAGDAVWGPGDVDVGHGRLSQAVEMLLRRQLDSGGFSPASGALEPQHARTYSTVVAVWALLEARQVLPEHGKPASLDASVANGLRWLLANYDRQLESWVPNPSRSRQLDRFPGLNAQILYVLELAREVPRFEALIDGDEHFDSARLAFFQSLNGKVAPNRRLDSSRSVDQNDRTHDGDVYLHGSRYAVEGSTYLWYPWALAYCARASTNTIDGDEALKTAVDACEVLGARANELFRFAKGDPFVYVMAESLLAINTYLSSVDTQVERRG